MTLEPRKEKMMALAKEYSQEHIFTFWDELKNSEKENLLQQIEHTDFAFIKKCYDAHQNKHDPGKFSPPRIQEHAELNLSVHDKGEKALRAGRVAILVVAGGQGSRLGYEGPKGMFKASPVKEKTLFQLLAEKILARNKTFGVVIDLYIMTSEENHQQTIAYFAEKNYFGLNPGNVVVFKQDRLPAIDEEGKLIMENTHSLCLSPSGTGAIYRSLTQSGLIKRMKTRSIDILYYVQIDNPLIPIVDPSFLGAHLKEAAEMSSLVVEKAYPEEKVGLIVEREGKTEICEYIHIPEEKATQRDEDGKLTYRAANIAIHIINREFITRIAEQNTLPIYLAHKKIACIDQEGDHIMPIEPNAYKFESFVFDALPQASASVTISAERDDVFAPIKNAKGKDSPASSKETQTRKYKKWLRAAGIQNKLVDKVEEVEISPLFALDQKEFIKKIHPHLELVEKQMKGQKMVYLS